MSSESRSEVRMMAHGNGSGSSDGAAMARSIGDTKARRMGDTRSDRIGDTKPGRMGDTLRSEEGRTGDTLRSEEGRLRDSLMDAAWRPETPGSTGNGRSRDDGWSRDGRREKKEGLLYDEGGTSQRVLREGKLLSTGFRFRLCMLLSLVRSEKVSLAQTSCVTHPILDLGF
jgi:hypothetical protein